MTREFDKALALHCSPVLAGIKPGNLISCSKAKYPNFFDLLAIYQTQMAYKGFRFEVVHECDKNYLLLVYRENLLSDYLNQPKIKDILKQAGYPTNDTNVAEILDYLRTRFATHCEFPHEIGVFLGYPAADVIGFKVNKGKNYQLCGHWKVYENPEASAMQFRRFDKCKNSICRRLSQGTTIMQMFCTA